jgi:hypothetical protein
MKKILIVLSLLCVLLNANAASKTITIAWDANPELDILGYKNYNSTNAFVTTNAAVLVTNALTYTMPIEIGPVYSLYVTAINTVGLESDPSAQLRYQEHLVYPKKTNNIVLAGTTNWVGAVLSMSPTNGILTGTPPNIIYTPTNITATSDIIQYKIATISGGTNVLNYYKFAFVYVNSPPNIRLQFGN